MRFTKEQENVINKGVHFYKHSSDQVFQFAGEAGTGKSVVLNEIFRRCGIPLNRIAPMAYIGQAAIVMRMKGLRNARTIHSWLYNPIEGYKLDENGNLIMNEYFNRPTTELKFEPKKLEDIVDVLAIDEGGSVPYSMKRHLLDTNKKIFVCGDLGQLPPVKDKPAFLYEGKVHYLTMPMRQSAESMIYYLAKRARNGLPINYGFYGNVLVIDEDDLTDQMLLNSDIVICGTNKTREIINKRVRNSLGLYTDLPQLGERVVCRKNNWRVETEGINLANGLIGTVTNQPGVDGFDGKNFKLNFQPNFLNSSFLDLTCDYNYFIAPYEQKRYLKNDKYNTAEKFEFAYAITTHMSQGGAFNNGIYIEEYISKEIQNNLHYTGITRFKHGLIYVKRKRKFY